MGGIFFKALIGALAGLAAWAIWEPQFPSIYGDPRFGAAEFGLIITLGGLVGMAICGLQGWNQGSRLHLIRGLFLGLVLGTLGALVGTGLGSRLLMAFFDRDPFRGDVPFPVRIFARALALTPLGLMIGSAIGISGWTGRRVLVGAIGGALGGLASGLLFDVGSGLLSDLNLSLKGGVETVQNGIRIVTAEVGGPGRALTAVTIGLFVGLFIGIVDRVTRTAWIRLVLGRKEGKEWVVDSPQTFVGRNESAHVPLFGDMNVAPMHAMIQRQGNAFILMDGGSPLGTYLNGQRIGQAPLFDGAQIQIGPHLLQFMMRHGSAPQRAAEQLKGQFYAPQPADPQAVPVGMATQSAAYAPVAPIPAPFAAPLQPTQVVTQVPQPAQRYVFVAVDGPIVGQRFEVKGPLEIGREGSGIRLGFDQSASRRHASVAPGPTGLDLADLGSTNGVFVNGQKVANSTIRPGDLVKIGATTFRVEQV